MTSILIRCDASLSIGSGHVMRCRTLARELTRRGAVVRFLCRRQPGDLIGFLEQEFAVLPLPELPLLATEGLVGRDLYQSWLGCSQAQDAADCLQALGSSGIAHTDWLVVDHYGLDASWQSHLLQGLAGESHPKLLVIDDLADRPHQADLLLDQNFFGDATEHRYEDLLPRECLQLLGPYYALLGPEYAQLYPLVPMRTELRRVLVFFGGVDPDNLTCRTLEALLDPALAHLAVDVVLGRQSPHRQAVSDLVAKHPFATLHSQLPSLAGLIVRADLAIGAGGATTWERACLKLPSLVVVTADNQLPFAEALHLVGHHQLLGEAATVSAELLRSVLLARVVHSAPQDLGGDLTDGKGVSRLALAMLGPQLPISLRPAGAGDEALLLRWANHSQVRASSFSPDLIASSDHPNWFLNGLPDPNRLLLVATADDGCPIGQIRFDREPLPNKGGSAVANVHLSFDPCARGFALSADLVRLGLQVMEQTWGPGVESVDQVLTTNAASNACFSRAGFVRESISPTAPFLPGCESLDLPPGHITILSDSGSWLNQNLPELIEALWHRGHGVRWIHHPSQLVAGDVCFMLSCGRLISAEQLALHRHNLVVHASDLPKGQGWSPMSWQILEGASRIPVTLFEAVVELDAGPIYLQQNLEMDGHELVNEWRSLLANATKQLCLEWLDRYEEVVAASQIQLGEPSYYKRRRPIDSQLDPDRTLADQFNLLRVVDNHNYPAFFRLGGRTFWLHVSSKHDDAHMM